MGDAPCENTDGLHLLGLVELFFEFSLSVISSTTTLMPATFPAESFMGYQPAIHMRPLPGCPVPGAFPCQ